MRSKSVLAAVAFIFLFIASGIAQDYKSEVSVQGTANLPKNSDNLDIPHEATKSGGFLIGYRYNFNRWLAAEANYGYDRNTQFYFGGTSARVQSDIHQFTGEAVVKLPTFARLQPYALAGAGALVFDPTGNAGGSFAGATLEAKGAFVYGVGAKYAFTRHLSLQAEYRGLVYKAPSFNLAGLNTDSWTQIAQPSAGIVFRF